MNRPIAHGLSLPRSAATGIAVACLALLIAGVAPVAAASNVNVFAEIGASQVFGQHAGAHKAVKLEWRDSDGALKSKQSVVSASDGSWISDAEPGEVVEAGDTIKMTIGATSATYTVAAITANADRVSDMVSGRAPANSQIVVTVWNFNGGFVDYTQEQEVVAVNGVGSYSADFSTGSSASDIKGFDAVFATLIDNRGDASEYSLSASALRIWEGRAAFDVVGNPGSSAEATLTRSATQLSDVTVPIGPDAFRDGNSFVDADGQRVRSQAGDQVQSNASSDENFTLPNVVITANKSTARATVNCGLGNGYGVEIVVLDRYGNAFGFGYGFTANGGVFTVKALKIKSGYKIDAYCKLATGDVVAKVLTVS